MQVHGMLISYLSLLKQCIILLSWMCSRSRSSVFSFLGETLLSPVITTENNVWNSLLGLHKLLVAQKLLHYVVLTFAKHLIPFLSTDWEIIKLHPCNMKLLRSAQFIKSEQDTVNPTLAEKCVNNPRICSSGHDMKLLICSTNTQRHCCQWLPFTMKSKWHSATSI